jgi:multiple sugar transport system substrate-binding protein
MFDYFLLFAAIVLCVVFIVVNLFFRNSAGFRRTRLLIARQSTALFGADTIAALIKEFEERNPELQIKIEAAGSGGQSPLDPDIVFFEEDRSGGPARQETLISLEPYMSAETGAEPASGARGSPVVRKAIPLVSFMDLLFYNAGILQALGFDRPPKTREEFFACAKAVSDSGGGVYGAALGLSPDDPPAPRREIFSWIWAAGADFFPPERGGRPYFGNKTAVDVIAFLGRLNREGVLAPGTFIKSGADRIGEFVDGKIAMMIASSQEIPRLKKQIGAFGVTVIPGGVPGDGKSRVGLSGIYAGISKNCANPDEAWTFLAFLAEKGPVLAAALEAVPGAAPEGLSGVFPGDYMKEDPLYSKAWDIFEAAETERGFSDYPHGDDYEAAVREALRTFFEQEQNPADAVTAIQRRWDGL